MNSNIANYPKAQFIIFYNYIDYVTYPVYLYNPIYYSF